ncbi:hypothetical protein ACFYMW_39270 [Streptomyces sp. NPDC006692]|uniref:hypothetical protein n=1 Tax=Streptomyces sp. NPDC006692 TaxID=3364758 RepID=UPI0036840974
MAEPAGHVRPGPMPRLLRSVRCNTDAVRDEIRAYPVDRLGNDGGVLIVIITACPPPQPKQPTGVAEIVGAPPAKRGTHPNQEDQ